MRRRGSPSPSANQARNPSPLALKRRMDSDDDRDRPSASTDAQDDVNLPKATVAKLVQGQLTPVPLFDLPRTHSHPFLAELLPPGYTIAKDAKDLIADCCKGQSPSSRGPPASASVAALPRCVPR